MLVPLAVLLLAGCGGGDDEGAAEEATKVEGIGPAPNDSAAAPPAPAGTVDTAGVGTNPPTAGGQLVDTAAVPGPTDTVQGTATAP